jgi:hypothetical protein
VEDADSTRTRQLAQKQRLPRPDAADRHAHASPALPAELGPELGPSPRRVLPQDDGSGDSRLAITPRAADAGSELAPSPRPADAGDRLGSGQLNVIPPFESVEARLPVLTPVPDLARKDVRDRIVSDLGRDPAFRLDLFVRDVPRAAAVFQSAARAAGWKISVESTAQDLLRKKVPTQLAVYTDSHTPDEIAKFLAALAKRDQADKTGPVFTIAHLVPFQPAEQRDLRDLFGVDLGPGKRKAGGAKPIAKSDEKKAAKPAIMLTYTPMAFRVNPAASKEIRAFLEQRTEHKPAGVPLLVVIRPVN